MTSYEIQSDLTATAEKRCDTKIWSGDCQQSNYTTSGDKYLCTPCGTISNLDHEVRHETFPYVSGDKDSLS